MAVTSIKVYREYKPVLKWLQDKVGPILHHKAIIFWHGQGWHLTIGHEPGPRGRMGKNYCVVDFEDEKTATWFELVWG